MLSIVKSSVISQVTTMLASVSATNQASKLLNWLTWHNLNGLVLCLFGHLIVNLTNHSYHIAWFLGVCGLFGLPLPPPVVSPVLLNGNSCEPALNSPTLQEDCFDTARQSFRHGHLTFAAYQFVFVFCHSAVLSGVAEFVKFHLQVSACFTLLLALYYLHALHPASPCFPLLSSGTSFQPRKSECASFLLVFTKPLSRHCVRQGVEVCTGGWVLYGLHCSRGMYADTSCLLPAMLPSLCISSLS